MNIFNQNSIFISRIIAAEKRTYLKGFKKMVTEYREHYDNLAKGFYTVFYLYDGEIEYTYPQLNKHYVIKKNQMMFIDRYHSFSFSTPNKDAQVYMFNFVADNGFIDMPGIYEPPHPELYLAVFKEGAKHFSKNKAGFEILSIASLMTILGMLKNDVSDFSSALNVTEKSMFAADIIKTNFSNPHFSVEALAEKLGVSTAYLRKIFAATFDISPIKYIKKIRAMHATDLLIAEDFSIAEVALKCGYSDVSYFCRDFKSTFGVTPLNYKNKRK